MLLRFSRLMLTLGLRHLLRLTAKVRRALRQLPVPETAMTQATWDMPRELTLVWVPLSLRPETALEMRTCLEDLVILLERIADRMAWIAGEISTSLRTR